MLKNLLVLCIVFSSIGLKAQLDSIVSIPEVSVTSQRFQLFDKGRTVIKYDSTQLIQYAFSDIGVLLSNESSIYFKESSPGNLSSPSIRGTGFSHVVTLWNGFPIQSPLNGGMDFSLLHVGDYNQISVLKGGNSAIYGSGAIGGTIALNNNVSYEKSFAGQVHLLGNSMQNLGINASFDTSDKEKIAANLKFNHYNNQNKYKFGPRKTVQEYAAHKLTSFSSSIQYKLNKRNHLKLWSQGDVAERSLSPSKTVAYNDDMMFTTTARLGLEWAHQRENWSVSTRVAHFRDSIAFITNSIDARSRTSMTLAQVYGKYYFKNGLKWELGVNEQYTVAKGTDFIDQNQNQFAVFSNLSLERNKWESSLSLRQELFKEETPYTFSLGGVYKMSSSIQWLGNISKNFRAPTINDLYWPGLGNPDLYSEQGWSGEVGLKYKQSNLVCSSTYFFIQGNDWISWSPNISGIWMPHNSQKVASNGLESSIQYNRLLGKKWKLYLSVSHVFTSSKLIADYKQVTSDIGKQLIYVPKSRFTSSISIAHHPFKLNYRHSITSKVRTIQKDIPRYHLGNVSLNYHPDFFKNRLSFGFNVNNVWNTDYEVVLYYPMPLRNFEVVVSCSF